MPYEASTDALRLSPIRKLTLCERRVSDGAAPELLIFCAIAKNPISTANYTPTPMLYPQILGITTQLQKMMVVVQTSITVQQTWRSVASSSVRFQSTPVFG